MNTTCTILTANVSGSEEYLIISPTIYFLIPKHTYIIPSEGQGNNVSIIYYVFMKLNSINSELRKSQCMLMYLHIVPSVRSSILF